MKPIIRVENLGKQYRIGRREAPYGSLRESLTRAARAPFNRLQRGFRGENGHVDKVSGARDRDHFWALREVGFEVTPGEVVGIIGRNGAGKSTLLKILSRITEPTEGSIDLYGQVGSLLEVGTGFHHELTGRENVYLSGAILGMARSEMDRQFDQIVDFAGMEKFIDTPVKHYSSGMYTRLAFAVAAHLETEIFLVDEVLAVGDAVFQKKCLGKLEEAGSSGRTVIFVSHNVAMVTRLCGRAILLDHGKLIADGPTREVTQRYIGTDLGSPAERSWPNHELAPGDSVARLHAVRILNEHGQVSDTIDIRKPLYVEVEYRNLQSSLRPTVSIHFINEEGVRLFVTNDFNNRSWWTEPRSPGLVRARCRVPGNFLAEGQIFVLAAVCSYNPDVVHAIEHDAVSFQVVDPSDGDGVRGDYAPAWPGVVRPMLEWYVNLIS